MVGFSLKLFVRANKDFAIGIKWQLFPCKEGMLGKLEDCVKTATCEAEYDNLRDASLKKQPFTRDTLVLSKLELTGVWIYMRNWRRSCTKRETLLRISFWGWSKGSSQVETEEQHANIFSKPLQRKKVVVVQWAASTNTSNYFLDTWTDTWMLM